MKKILTLVLVSLLGIALAHSKPAKISPTYGSSVKSAKMVSIAFDEAIEPGFSTFKVYAYSGALTESAMDRYSEKMLKLKNDAAARADVSFSAKGITNGKGPTKNIDITLKPNLKAGTYLVMWRILGADTHSVTSNSYFRIKP